jgi:hypothetical protein
MLRRDWIRSALIALLCVLLTTASATAAGRGGSPARRPQRVESRLHPGEILFSQAWRWMQSLWEKNGACIDPNGSCKESGAGAPSQLDEGACIDPNGAPCVSTPSGN